MYYSYKNCKLLIDGKELLINQAELSLQSENSPVYLSESKNSLTFSPTNGIGGNLKISYYLTGLDPIKKLIDLENTGVSGYFAGLSFETGYLRNYTFNGAPNSPILINAEIVFFNQLSGLFKPTFEQTQDIPTLNFSDATLNNLVNNSIGSINNINNISFNYTSEISPSYLADTTVPIRVVFGKTTKTLDITTDIISGDLPIYGKQAAIQINLNHPIDSTITESFICQGILYQRNLTSSVGQPLKSVLRIKQNAVENLPIFYYFQNTSGNIGNEIDIFGKNFSYVNSVEFNGVEDESFFVVNDNEIISHVPIGASSGPVTITNRGGSIDTDFNFIVLQNSLTISDIIPQSGVYNQTINLFGQNLSLVDDVKFSNLEANFNIINNNLIKTNVPFNATLDYINIFSSALGASGQSPVKFIPIPQINGFSPNSGIIGDFILISGNGFSGVTGVYFNNLLSTGIITYINNTGIIAQVPSGNVRGFISLYGQSGVNSRSFDTFYPLALITGLNPLSGVTGINLQILGKNFLDEILFPTFGNSTFLVSVGNGTGAFKKVNNNLITGILPSGANTGPVVLYDSTQAPYPSNFNFNLLNSPPLIISLIPNSGKFGDTVYLQGKNFFNVSTLALSGTQITGLNTTQYFPSYLGDNIAINIPNISGGLYNIIVNTQAGNVTGNNLLTVLVSPTISGFSPLTGIAGDLISLSGNNIYYNSSVYINNTGIPALVKSGSYSNNNSLQFYIPQNLTNSSNQVIVFNTVDYATGLSNLITIPLTVIKSFNPLSGIYRSSVSISGSGFLTTSGVSFGQFNSNFSIIADTGIIATVPNLSSTDYINVTNVAGKSSSSGKFIVLVPSIIISGFSPTVVDFGDTLLISGAYLDTTAQVRFSGISSEIPITSFNKIGSTGVTVIIPNNIIGGQIKLVNASGVTLSNQSLQLVPYPSILSINPATGIYNDLITISGNNLSGASFLFRGLTGDLIPPLQTTIIGNTGAFINVPREIISSPIYVSGQRPKTFPSNVNFIPLPTISGFVPTGLLTGSVLIITGINAFQIQNIVGISGSTAYNIFNTLFTDYNRITGAGVTSYTGYSLISGIVNSNYIGSGKIFLVSSNDKSISSINDFPNSASNSFSNKILSNSFLTIQESPPIINGFFPNRGNQTTLVQITGNNFTNTSSVLFLGDSYTGTGTIINSSLYNINVNPPNNFLNASGLIQVATPYGSTTSSSYFTFISAPTISGFSPSNGAAGTLVLITGSNLRNITGLLFGNTPANFTIYSGNNTFFVTGITPFVIPGPYTISLSNELGQSSLSTFTVNAGVQASGNFYPGDSNPSGYVTSSQTGNLTGLFYPLNSNPSGYLRQRDGQVKDNGGIASVNWQNRILTDNGNVTSMLWQSRFLIASDNSESIDWDSRLLVDNTNTASLDWQNKNLSTTGWTLNNINFLSWFYPLTGNPSGFITTGQTGAFGGGTTPTGILTGVFYPLNTNPSGYITSNQTGNFVTSFQSGFLTGTFYPLQGNPSGFITPSQTGTFVNSFQSGLLTGVFYPLQGNPSGFITNSQTGNFITTSQTGGFVNSFQTGLLSGIFYPLKSNPSGYLIPSQTGILTSVFYPLIGNPSGFITTGQTGSFGGGSTPTGALTGVFYPLTTNPSGYLTIRATNVSTGFGTMTIDWRLSDTFQVKITGNTNFNFTGLTNGQTIVVAVINTGNLSGNWPGNGGALPSGISGIKWPFNTQPSITPTATDVFTFIDLNNIVYGSVVQAF